jgi:ABC-type polysaccharide/polyol phosphate transport system ATPase subunit
VEEVPLLPIRMSEEKTAGDMNDGDVCDEEEPFQLKDIVLRVPNGSFVAIVGRVGSGKVIVSIISSTSCILTFQ